AGSHRVGIFLTISNGTRPEFILQTHGLRIQTFESRYISFRNPVLHPDIDVLAKKTRDLGSFRRGEECRTKEGGADSVGFFQHKLLARLEARYGHGHSESEQQAENAKYRSFDSRNL